MKALPLPSTFNWEFSPKGQHVELGIAEMNLFMALRRLDEQARRLERHAAVELSTVDTVT